MLIGVYNIDKEEGPVDTSVLIHSGGREYTVPAGTQIRLRLGESITIQPRLHHGFHLEPDTRSVLSGEVFMCDGDNQGSRFYLLASRFPAAEEDESPFRLLRNEYSPADGYAKQ